MIPLHVSLKNYRSFEHAEVNLEGLGGATLAGENGAGKSSLIEAMFWCWFDESRSGARGADRVVRIGRELAIVEVIHEAGGQRFKTQRTRSTKGRGKSTAELWRLDAGAWTPITGKTIDETNEKIRQSLGISYDTLISGPVILQDDADRFTRAKPEERREILRQILRLDEYRTLASEARAKGNEKAAQAAALTREAEYAGEVATQIEMAQAAVADRVSERAAVELAEQEAHAADAKASHEAARARDAEADHQRHLTQRPALGDALHRAHLTRMDASEAVQRLITTIVMERETSHAENFEVPELEGAEKLASSLASGAAAANERRRGLETRKAELVKQYVEGKRRRDLALQDAAGLAEAQSLAAHEPAILRAATDSAERVADTRAAIEPKRLALVAAKATSNAAADVEQARLRELGNIDSHPDVAEARQEAERRAQAVSGKEMEANIAFDARTRCVDAYDRTKTTERKAREAIGWRTEAIARLEKRGELLAEVPCTQSPLWGPVDSDGIANGRACDLAGACKLLADARASVVELAAERERLDETHATLDTACAAVTAAEQQFNLANAEWQAALEAVRVAKTEAQEALRNIDAVRADVRRTYQEEASKAYDAGRVAATAEHHALVALDTATEAWRAAGVAYDEAQHALTRATNAAERVEAKKAAQARADEEGQQLAEVTRQGEAIRDELVSVGGPHDEAELQRTLDDVRRRLEKAKATAARRPVIEEAKAQIAAAQAREAQAAQAERTAQEALDACEPDSRIGLRAAETAQTEAAARAALRAAREKATSAAQAVTRAEGIVEHLEARLADLETKRARGAGVAEDARLWAQTADALQIAAILLIERAIPVIEAEANRVLQRISSRGMRLTLETQKQNKTTEGTREALDVIVQDAVGVRPYEDFSGGEKFRINMALRLGLARLLADREGVPVEFLVIDEGGFGALDPDGIAALKDVVAALQQDFRLILLVTHIPDVADALPHQINIRQNGAGSVIEVAA